MYFWKVNKLEQDLKADKISNMETLGYLVVLVLINLIAFFFVGNVSLNGSMKFMDNVLSGLINIFGIIFCFYLNKQGDGTKFLKRIVSLTLPISIRIEVYHIFATFTLMLIGFFVSGGTFTKLPQSEIYNVSSLVIGQIFLFVSYIWLGRVIKRISVNKCGTANLQ